MPLNYSSHGCYMRKYDILYIWYTWYSYMHVHAHKIYTCIYLCWCACVCMRNIAPVYCIILHSVRCDCPTEGWCCRSNCSCCIATQSWSWSTCIIYSRWLSMQHLLFSLETRVLPFLSTPLTHYFDSTSKHEPLNRFLCVKTSKREIETLCIFNGKDLGYPKNGVYTCDLEHAWLVLCSISWEQVQVVIGSAWTGSTWTWNLTSHTH